MHNPPLNDSLVQPGDEVGRTGHVDDPRSRTFSWPDPRTVAAAASDGRTGLEFMRAFMSGELPPAPIGAMLEMELIEVTEGRTVFALTPAEWMFNPIGSVHGGVAATLLDSCMACAVHTRLPARTGYTSTDIQVRYLRGMDASTGRVLAEGIAEHVGRRHATASGILRAERTGKTIATGTTGIAILNL